MKPYPKYKPSEVDWLGEVPEHWEIKRLRFLCKLNPSKSEIAHVPGYKMVSFLPMENIGENGELNLEENKTLDNVYQNGFTYFAENDVLIAKITPCFENGKGAIAQGLTNQIGFGTTELHILRLGRDVFLRYIWFVTKSQPFRDMGEAMMIGSAGQKRVPERFINDYPLCLPDIEEQRTIAEFLDRKTSEIDQLIEKKQRLIELLQEKRTALISHVVTKGLDPNVKLKPSGVDWLGDVPEHWGVRICGNVYQIQLGKMLQPEATSSEDFQISYFKAQHVQWENVCFDELPTMWISKYEKQKYSVKNGDLLVCEGGEVGRAAILSDFQGEAVIQNALHRVRLKSKSSVTFLMYILKYASSQHWFDIICNKATIAHFTGEKFSALRVPFPQIQEQRDIAEYLDKKTAEIDELVNKTKQHIELLHEYRTSLISAAVTGKIDVRKALK